jgi:hypothetical protein
MRFLSLGKASFGGLTVHRPRVRKNLPLPRPRCVFQGGQDVLVEEHRGQLRSAADAELGEDRLDVVADGVGRDPERLGDGVDGLSAHEQLRDLALALGQLGTIGSLIGP